MRIPRMPTPSTTPHYPVTDAEREEQAREAAIMREHYAAMDKIAQEVLGPVSVKEIEDVVFEMEDNLPDFARRIILQRKQMKRMSDAIQAMMGHESRIADLEAKMDRVQPMVSHLSAWANG